MDEFEDTIRRVMREHEPGRIRPLRVPVGHGPARRPWARLAPAAAAAAVLVVVLTIAGVTMSGHHAAPTTAAGSSSAPSQTDQVPPTYKTLPGPSTPESPADKATMGPPRSQTEPPVIPAVRGPQAAKDVDGYVAKRVTPTGGWGLLCGTYLFYYLVAGQSVDTGTGVLYMAQSNGFGLEKDAFITPPGTTSLTIRAATCAAVTLSDASGTVFTYVPGASSLVPR